MNRTLRFSLMTATVSLGISALLAARPARLYAESAPGLPACWELRVSTCAGDAGADCDLGGTVGRCVAVSCQPDGGGRLVEALECRPIPPPLPTGTASPSPVPSGSAPVPSGSAAPGGSAPTDDAGGCSTAPTPGELSGAATGLSLAAALVLGLRRRRAVSGGRRRP